MVGGQVVCFVKKDWVGNWLVGVYMGGHVLLHELPKKPSYHHPTAMPMPMPFYITHEHPPKPNERSISSPMPQTPCQFPAVTNNTSREEPQPKLSPPMMMGYSVLSLPGSTVVCGVCVDVWDGMEGALWYTCIHTHPYIIR